MSKKNNIKYLHTQYNVTVVNKIKIHLNIQHNILMLNVGNFILHFSISYLKKIKFKVFELHHFFLLQWWCQVCRSQPR